MEIYNILQAFIYSFNKNSIRDSVVKNVVYDRNKYVWKGTFLLDRNTSFQEYRKWDLQNNKIYLFTVAYVYRENNVHYVAFIFNPSKKEILCFDPGYNLYMYGKHKIIPMIVNELYSKNLINEPIILKGKCPRKKFGLQWNGQPSTLKSPLPADAFCQIWTLFFIVNYLKNHGSICFFESWCKVRPKWREYFVIQQLILPSLQSIPSLKRVYGKKKMDILTEYLFTNFWSKI